MDQKNTLNKTPRKSLSIVLVLEFWLLPIGLGALSCRTYNILAGPIFKSNFFIFLSG